PAETILVSIGDASAAIRGFMQDTHSRYQFLKSDRERPILPPDALFLQEEALFTRLKDFPRLALSGEPPHPDFAPVPNVAIARRADDPAAALRKLLDNAQTRVVLCADTAGRRETISEMLEGFGLRPQANMESLQDFIDSDVAFGLIVAPVT